MNWTSVTRVILVLLALPLCVIGVTALAGGMLMAGRLSRREEEAFSCYPTEEPFQ